MSSSEVRLWCCLVQTDASRRAKELRSHLDPLPEQRGHQTFWWPKSFYRVLCRKDAAHNPNTGSQSASLIDVKMRSPTAKPPVMDQTDGFALSPPYDARFGASISGGVGPDDRSDPPSVRPKASIRSAQSRLKQRRIEFGCSLCANAAPSE